MQDDHQKHHEHHHDHEHHEHEHDHEHHQDHVDISDISLATSATKKPSLHTRHHPQRFYPAVEDGRWCQGISLDRRRN
mgnify:FL=1